MGGNIWKNPPTIRLNATEYIKLTDKVLTPLREKFGDYNFYLLPSYRLKESHGDADVLINHIFKNYDFIIEFIKTSNNLDDNDVSHNSNVVSMRIENFQFDFIFCNPKNYETSKFYYNYSDLGNFLGRIVHRTGFKLGMDGLTAVYNYNNYEFAVNNISKNYKQILKFVDYDPDLFDAGFDTLEDIYKYASSSMYFNKKIFELQNRNHTAKTRGCKRAAYRGFLEWMENREDLPAYVWGDFSEKGNKVIKPEFLQRVFEFFPDYEPIHNKTMKEFDLWKNFKEILNGENVSLWTGLSGIELGIFMKHLKSLQQDNFKQYIVEIGLEKTKEFVISKYKSFEF